MVAIRANTSGPEQQVLMHWISMFGDRWIHLLDQSSRIQLDPNVPCVRYFAPSQFTFGRPTFREYMVTGSRVDMDGQRLNLDFTQGDIRLTDYATNSLGQETTNAGKPYKFLAFRERQLLKYETTYYFPENFLPAFGQ